MIPDKSNPYHKVLSARFMKCKDTEKGLETLYHAYRPYFDSVLKPKWNLHNVFNGFDIF
jgi:hypothetical protein